MAGSTETTSEPRPGRHPAGVVAGTFGVIVLLAAIAYAVIVTVVDWVTVGWLAYPAADVAPFVVITGAILTIPIVIPTVLVSLKLAQK
ncbi:hypothetical protein [Halohasta salina]|uniref:hypothetical protein n=1 Tax=Halohasta salina TaxID=2961621 RepID=UPI0020A47436|nr:hypothetical protein [Halohasta salina]